METQTLSKNESLCLLAIDYQLSTINYQRSIINYQLSIINYQLSMINYQLLSSEQDARTLNRSKLIQVDGQNIYVIAHERR